MSRGPADAGRRRRVLAAGAALAAAGAALTLIAGCSGGDADGVSGTATSQAAVPPPVYIQAAAHDFLAGGAGPYCWDGACDSAALPVTTETPFEIAAGSQVALVFAEGRPTDLVLRWLDGSSPPAAAEGIREWPDIGNRTVDSEGAQAPVRPGQYLLVVDATWPRGQVRYSFYVAVRSP